MAVPVTSLLNMLPKSRSSSTSSTYSHLLYLNSEERDIYISSQYFSSETSLQQLSPLRPESTSFFSMTSSRCSSARTSTSSQDSVSTKPSSVKSATISTPKYADDHYPLINSVNPSSIVSVPTGVPRTHAAFYCAQKMAAIHNTMIRALNSAYNHASSVVAGTQRCQHFIRFNQILCTMVKRHHEVEDDFLFPAWEKLIGEPRSLETSTESHKKFMKNFYAFQDYVSDPEAADNFDAFKFRKAIESFAPELIQHLHDEIPTIVNLCTVDDSALHKIWEQAEKLIARDADMHTFGPMVLGCQDKTFRIDGEIPAFPGLPWVASVFIRKWYARKHAEVWEFCPSDLQGQRRLLNA